MHQISQAAVDLIVAEEITSRAYYNARCRHFEWPGGASGPTVGIGYDCGHVTRDELAQDWAGLLDANAVAWLQAAVGIKGAAARDWVRQHGRGVTIEYDVAMRQFSERELPKWIERVRASLPRFAELPPDCAGAIVSLAYNRGCSWDLTGDRYVEMAWIKQHMLAGDFAAIPGEIRRMARLWTGAVHQRRLKEAALFERGLAGPAPAVSEIEPAEAVAEVDPQQDYASGGIVSAGPSVVVGERPSVSIMPPPPVDPPGCAPDYASRRRPMQPRPPIPHMGQSTTGNTAVGVGTTAGPVQISYAAADAAAQSATPRQFAIALLRHPLFITGMITLAGMAYVWFERWRKFKTEDQNATAHPARARRWASRRRPMQPRPPIPHMGQSTTGNTAVGVGTTAGPVQISYAAADAAAQSATPRQFAIALLRHPLFITGMITLAGMAYVWFERWRKFKTEDQNATAHPARARRW